MKKSLLQPGFYISRKVAVTIAALLITTFGVFAQTQTVKGKVTDSKTGDPLPGVNVVAKGTATGVITDIDGNYTFNVPDGTAVIVYSFIGMQTVEIPFTGQSTINVKLEESSIGLDEVVAIGYGVTTKRDLTGAVSSIKTDELVQTPVANVAQAMQGKLSGVTVSAQDGRPGADIKIRIRGGGSITQSNDPLVVVDGIQGVSLSEIPADQIESIDVLKDASSTAIYGARGANGVILVTTKGLNNPKGTTKVSYSTYMQSKEIAKTLEPLNTQDYLLHGWSYMTAMQQSWGDDFALYYGLGTANVNALGHSGMDAWNDYASVPIHNYTDDLLRSGWLSSEHNISVSTATEKTMFAINANTITDDGIKIKSGYKRHNLQFKLDHELYKNFKIGLNLNYIQSRNEGNESTSNGVGSILSSAYRFRPIDNPLGQYDPIPSGFGNGDVNVDMTYDPYQETINIEDIRYLQRFRGLGYINWEVVKGLTLRTEIGGSRRYNENQYYNAGIALPDANNRVSDRRARIDLGRGYSYRSTTTAFWKVQGLGEHDLSILGGMEFTKSQGTTSRIFGQSYPANFDFETAIAKIQFAEISTFDEESGLYPIKKLNFDFYNDIGVASTTNSYFGRLNYGFKGRYLLTATMRADGSSKFAPNKRWGYFPSGALGWRVSDETFMENTQGWLDNLKLRLSVGSAGSDNIPYSAWNALYSVNFSDNGVITYDAIGVYPNPDLKWETTVSRNIGLDYSVFNGRIYGSFELYSNYTKDLLGEIPTLPASGFTTKFENIGKTSNKGIEVAFNADIIRKKDFTVSFNATYNYNKNNIEKLKEGIITAYGTDWNSTSTYPRKEFLFKEGTPVGTVQGYVYEGYYNTSDFNYDSNSGQYTLKDGVPYYDNFNEIGNYPNPFNVVRMDSTGTAVDVSTQIFPGALKIKDTNGDGKITSDDATTLGEVIPRHTGGFGLNVYFKGIDLSTSFAYALGGHVYNIAKLLNTTGRKDYTFGSNSLSFIKDSYKYYNINESGDLVAVTNPDQLNAINMNARYHTPYQEFGLVLSEWFEKSDYLRMNTLTVGYSLPKQLTSKISIDRIRLYFTGGNLLTITSFSGLDPEVSTNEGKGEYATPGLNFGAYPRARTYTFGLNVDF
ncbi:SusC/RagA family TonB-linked outer membrane protein [Saccharicrinis sp. FJH54]|uniref:SusC/RagA family TonB-linked outer membrane protein n=1 Tax=Saccharicrinis sp. FJH54 TaxID=3344665 RepID=UPI0035D50F90